MSSIVSRRPPPSVSTNQANDFFWMSMRFGTSIDLSRRAKGRRVREASTEAKAATHSGERADEVRARRATADERVGATYHDKKHLQIGVLAALGPPRRDKS